ncbi:unnamed protein product [Arabidopsis thaliana]|uniref:Uncharacterized protein n=1 Tax=Arabidopsis thaliana TaxID=3702 RepID=A0A5S9XHT8_ARATH|nr:unnamed protein product [Arabidopsis thaliana]
MDRGTCQKGEIFVVHHHHHRRVLPEVSNTSHMTLATVTGAVVDIVEAVKGKKALDLICNLCWKFLACFMIC